MGPKKQGFCSKINFSQTKLLYFVNNIAWERQKLGLILENKVQNCGLYLIKTCRKYLVFKIDIPKQKSFDQLILT